LKRIKREREESKVINTKAGHRIWTACNWAVGAWVFGSVGMYQYCQYKRQMEKAGMTRAMEILSKKDMEKKAREARKEKMREERRKAKDQDQDVQLAALAQAKDAKEGGNGGGSWWKPW
jgi:cytochrome c oxidase assembly protein subunit 20